MTTQPKEIKNIQQTKFKTKNKIITQEFLQNKFGVNSVKDLNIYQKIGIIQVANLDVEKKGYNEFEKYKYKTFTDIKRVVNPYLDELNLMIWGQEDRESTKIETTSKGKKAITFNKRYDIVNLDNVEEKLSVETIAYGLNANNEKAQATAHTYSTKNMFNQSFLIPDEALDSDALDNSQPQGESVVQTPQNVQAPLKFPESVKVWLLNEVKTNKELKEKWGDYKKKNDIKSLETLTNEQWLEISKLDEEEKVND